HHPFFFLVIDLPSVENDVLLTCCASIYQHAFVFCLALIAEKSRQVSCQRIDTRFKHFVLGDRRVESDLIKRKRGCQQTSVIRVDVATRSLYSFVVERYPFAHRCPSLALRELDVADPGEHGDGEKHNKKKCYADTQDRKSTRLNSSHVKTS